MTEPMYEKYFIVCGEKDFELLKDDLADWLLEWLDGFGSHEAISATDGVTLLLPTEPVEGTQVVVEFQRLKS